MANDQDLARQLHDKATRGGVLSDDERTQLDEWYARQDQEEFAQLDPTLLSPTLVALRAQVDSAVAELATVTQRIQSLAAENDTIRQEIAELHQRLSEGSRAQPA